MALKAKVRERPVANSQQQGPRCSKRRFGNGSNRLERLTFVMSEVETNRRISRSHSSGNELPLKSLACFPLSDGTRKPKLHVDLRRLAEPHGARTDVRIFEKDRVVADVAPGQIGHFAPAAAGECEQPDCGDRLWPFRLRRAALLGSSRCRRCRLWRRVWVVRQFAFRQADFVVNRNK